MTPDEICTVVPSGRTVPNVEVVAVGTESTPEEIFKVESGRRIPFVEAVATGNTAEITPSVAVIVLPSTLTTPYAEVEACVMSEARELFVADVMRPLPSTVNVGSEYEPAVTPDAVSSGKRPLLLPARSPVNLISPRVEFVAVVIVYPL
jgi:hypothetical protein